MATNPNKSDTNGENTSPVVQINVSGPITVYYGGVNPPSTLDTKRLVRSVAAKLGAAALAGMSGEELTTLFAADGDTKSRGYMSGEDADKAIKEAQDFRAETDVPDADPEVVDGGETMTRLKRESVGFEGPVTREWLCAFAGDNGFDVSMGTRLHTALDRQSTKEVLALHGVTITLGDNGGYRVEDIDVAARLGDELVAAKEAYLFGKGTNEFLQKLAAFLGGSTVDEDKLLKALDESGFRGTVGREEMIEKAMERGFPGDAGARLWNLLDVSPELRELCENLQEPFPPLGKNAKFRVGDLRRLAELEGITSVPGLGMKTQAYRTLRAFRRNA